MRLMALALLSLLALPFGSMADKPPVSHAMIKAMEDSIDGQLRSIWPNDPAEIIGPTQGTYIGGYGAVFVSEVNLAPSAGISPFHKSETPDEVRRIHEKNLARIPKLKSAMKELLMNSAVSLDSIPADEQIALGVTLFYWRWQNTDGLPAQIVMHGQKRALIDIKTGRADKSTLSSVITEREY